MSHSKRKRRGKRSGPLGQKTGRMKTSAFDGPGCENCGKPMGPPSLCVCAITAPTSIQRKVLILQHPQEPDKVLGSAKMAQRMLPQSKLVVGLSWANLAKAWGEAGIDPKKWGVLYLGSGVAKSGEKPHGTVIAVDKKGAPLALSGSDLGRTLEGIVVLDGTWSQAKAIWWRNAWLLKLQRIVLLPKAAGLYGNLRREPKREAVSTLEAVAEVLEGIGESKDQTDLLRAAFKKHLDQFRAITSSAVPAASP